MATTTNLGKVHVFPSEDSYNTNKGSVGANDLALVPIGAATTSEYGLTRLASEADVLSEKAGAVVHVPLAYELNDFRRLNTAYNVGDKVNCAFKFEYFLECTQAGTTSANTLDTRNVTFGQTITDGTVKWIVRAHVKSVNGHLPDANGNIGIDLGNYALDNNVVHKTGNEIINGTKTFKNATIVDASVGYVLQRSNKDFTVIPETNVQTWFGRYNDKNGLSSLLFKHYQYADGRTELALTDINYYQNPSGDWCSLGIGHYADGTRYMKAQYDLPDGATGYEIVNAKWLRAFLADNSRSNLVHTVNDETIAGNKTFSRPIINSSAILITSAPWDGIGINDESRTNSPTRVMAEVLDKDSKRFVAIEVVAASNGNRVTQFVMRKRDNSGWSYPFQMVETKDGNTYLQAQDTPSASDSSKKLATTEFVKNAIKSVVLDTFFPIGSIYMDATGNVDPNTQFGGTWAKIEDRFLLASGTKSVGATGGSETVTLTENQMPKHYHKSGTMNITGIVNTFWGDPIGGAVRNDTTNGALYPSGIADNFPELGEPCNEAMATRLNFQANRAWSGSTTSSGNNEAHDNMPPYQVVAVWKRTA